MGSTSKKIQVEFSAKEADYIQGMLEAYKSQLHVERDSGEVIEKEIRMADRIGRKLLFA